MTKNKNGQMATNNHYLSKESTHLNSHQDITEEFTESNLRTQFHRSQNYNCISHWVDDELNTSHYASTDEGIQVGSNMITEKKWKNKNMWRTMGNIITIFTQRNYKRLIKKWFLEEIEEIKEKVKGWPKE